MFSRLGGGAGSACALSAFTVSAGSHTGCLDFEPPVWRRWWFEEFAKGGRKGLVDWRMSSGLVVDLEGYHDRDVRKGKSQGGEWHPERFGDACEGNKQRRGNETCDLTFVKCYNWAPSAYVGSMVHEPSRQFQWNWV